MLENGTLEELKEKIEVLTNEFHIMSTKLYEQAQAEAGGEPAGASYEQDAGSEPDNVVDADFEVVDDDNNSEE